MAGESTQTADPNKMAASVPASSPSSSKRKREIEVGLRVPKNFRGCKCLFSRCEYRTCQCFKRGYRCTSKCECQDCDNPHGKGSDPELDLDMNKLPEEAEEPAQMEEQRTQSRDNRGSDPNKRPRNN